MPSFKAVPLVILLLAGASLALGNLWFTAVRSTIPLEIHGKLLVKEQRPEKKPGVDDVYLMKLAQGRVLQVDRAVFDFVDDGEDIEKSSWSAQLRSGSRTMGLTWSKDFRRMLWVMAAVLLALVALGVRASGRDAEPGNPMRESR